ncbi:Mg2+ transporter protein CorA-like/Zinc transport protein ZntB [Botryosphaeria dothidea]|uniref:Mg2+ transporter protein CorA-like/Zinc transport protein ZntB n=1 Tax=Botryosphaeria dothidea TaxID=55169 RepID=A0A8H4J5Z2_9PEZI|nr:Mg2+ transporter protein CorA-like/Zinc transport protein ZntB [Botryosphaeria dothidea]
MSSSTDDLIRQLEEQRAAFLALEQRVHTALRQQEASRAQDESPSSPTFSDGIGRQSTISFAEPSRKSTGIASLLQSSAMSVDSDDEDDETYYVRTPLQQKSLAEEDLRTHLRTYEWESCGQTILEEVVHDGQLLQPYLFPDPGDEERSHISSYQVFDVGPDGSPLSIEMEPEEEEVTQSKAASFWNVIKAINVEPDHRPAVGRIVIAQEPAPIAFGALHYSMNDHFDMNELFQHLVNSEHSSVQSLFTASSSVFDAYARSLLTPVSKATPHRPFSEDNRHQRTFTFSFEYYTVIGEERQPMHWQSHDKRLSASSSHLPLTRCSSVVSLALLGDPIKKVRNTSRRKNVKVRQGLVYDPFSPWLVLNIQAYPDWIGTADAHDSSKHYVNGPEAFLATVLMEFRDARKRYEEIYKQITKMITPPPDFIFDEDQRDKRLFEDANFTYTRGYFWAHQTLGSINDSIKAMIDAYEDTFTDEVWEGKHKSIWPLLDEALPRNDHFRRKLYLLRKEFEREVKHLEAQIKENNDRRLEIRDLRDQLFSGTSVLESRKSVELSEITILQGHNVKLLTLINIFFMPLTFVTSVFGMTNMPTEHSFWEFGTVLVTVCVPFFLLIGSLNTTKGYEFWKARCKEVMKSCLWFLAFMSGLTPKSTRPKKGQSREGEEEKLHRSYSRRPSCSSGVRHRLQRSPTSTNMEKDDSTDSSEDGGKGKKRWYDPSFLKRISRKNEKDESQTQAQEV